MGRELVNLAIIGELNDEVKLAGVGIAMAFVDIFGYC